MLLAGKAATIRRFENSPSGSWKKKLILLKNSIKDEISFLSLIKKEEPVTKKKKKKKSAITDDSKLMYDSKYSFTDYSFTTKYDKLLSFYHRLNEFRNLVPQKEKTKNKRESA